MFYTHSGFLFFVVVFLAFGLSVDQNKIDQPDFFLFWFFVVAYCAFGEGTFTSNCSGCHDEATVTFCHCCCCCYFILCLAPVLPRACGSFVCLLTLPWCCPFSPMLQRRMPNWPFSSTGSSLMTRGTTSWTLVRVQTKCTCSEWTCVLFNLYLILICCIRRKIFHSCLVCCRSEIPTEIYPFPWYFCDCDLFSWSLGFWKEPVAWWCIESLKLRQNVWHFTETSGIQSLKFRQHFNFWQLPVM